MFHNPNPSNPEANPNPKKHAQSELPHSKTQMAKAICPHQTGRRNEGGYARKEIFSPKVDKV
jgi:hypothetical protein